MAEDYSDHLLALVEHDLLPSRYEAVFVAGSVVQGWGNTGSDIDIYVICDEAPSGVETAHRVGLQPDAVAVSRLMTNDQKLDIEYWQDGQVDQLLDKVSWKEFYSGDVSGDRLSWPELRFLERVDHAVPIAGASWLERRREQTRSTAIRSLMVSRALNYTTLFIEDAIGQLESDDVESAVLSARLAFGYVIDALLAGEGKYGQSGKWRARRFRAVEQDVISFEDYWAVETMQDFQPDEPTIWVRRVVATCRQIARQVVV
ncbi:MULTISPECIES: hypothetical protein [unclassified Micromonospora]|uniref:hypothetical protein n=1 Tax=unclassified Micromonospora TaxID=2617518 RepID=UPI00188E8DDF|nr:MULTISPECIES: hypothetical protein [unclassified Micromonospora]MBF5028528.1 hypothetical protein [Micromonospora sp. ANENR4]MCZ7472999.1 hypothetical protein [Micromonospora sp. WMMC273]WBC03680.1 hypothetical protein O7546_01500 [Micromonospora sp. WMMA1976]